MFKIKIFSVGKTKEAWLQSALAEYVKRLQTVAELEFILVKTDEQLENLVTKEDGVICLDPKGTLLNSEEFADFLLEELEKQHSRFAFVIGGADGLTESIKKGRRLISLSRLTFTHQLTRLVLTEQLYRAFEIHKGSGYHK